jgi:hypothetical protein
MTLYRGGLGTVEAFRYQAGYQTMDFSHADKREAEIAGSMTLDQASRVASNIAKLPTLLSKA